MLFRNFRFTYLPFLFVFRDGFFSTNLSKLAEKLLQRLKMESGILCENKMNLAKFDVPNT